jgi:hypothetical protein
MRVILLVYIAILSCSWSLSQSGISFINFDPYLDTLAVDVLHTTVKPLIRVQNSNIGYSLLGKVNRTKPDPSKKQLELSYFPVVNMLSLIENSGSTSIFHHQLSAGAGLVGSYGEKWSFQGTFTGGYFSASDNGVSNNNLLRDSYLMTPQSLSYGEFTPLFRGVFTPNRYFNVQAGIDRHFIGEGMRSMILGDYGAPFPFVQLRTALWRLEFVNLFQFLREDESSQWVSKMASSHMLNYRVNKRLQIGIFESVIFEPRDTLLKRGFEWEYLNPFLFYRPTEYSIGSQDKIVIGAHFSVDLKPVMVYGQFALDDFVLNELRNRTRWWSNKYAGQIGFKGKHVGNRILISYLSELNFARPFTFAHLSQRTSYSHMGMPLGHPMGANFVESFTRIRAGFKNSLYAQLDVMFAQQGGRDSNDDYGFGEDVLRPYTQRPFEYGYFIGGHGKLNRLRVSTEIGYTLSKINRIDAFVRPIIEVQTTDVKQTFAMLFVGIRSNLWNNRHLSF